MAVSQKGPGWESAKVGFEGMLQLHRAFFFPCFFLDTDGRSSQLAGETILARDTLRAAPERAAMGGLALLRLRSRTRRMASERWEDHTGNTQTLKCSDPVNCFEAPRRLGLVWTQPRLLVLRSLLVRPASTDLRNNQLEHI